MSLFHRDAAGPPKPSAVAGSVAAEPRSGRAAAAPGAGSAATLIAQGSRLQGQVTGSAELWIEGEVEGEIRVEAMVVVGPHGRVAGPLTGRVVRVEGRVAGDVRAHDRVEVSASGSVEGKLAAPRVVIAEGAFFKGRIEMSGNAVERGKEVAGAERTEVVQADTCGAETGAPRNAGTDPGGR